MAAKHLRRNSNNIYQSKKYYHENYPQISLEESTAWTANHLMVIKSLFPQIKDYMNKKVLEIGSSYGGFINNLNKDGFGNVTCSDMNKSILSDKIKNRFIFLDITDINRIKEKFDVIFAFEVLEHIAEDKKIVKNIFHLLSENGLFIFTVPYPRNHNLYDPYHINMQYPNYWTNLFNKQGFNLLKLEEVTFLPFIWKYIRPFFFFRSTIKYRLFTNEVFFIFQKQSKFVP